MDRQKLLIVFGVAWLSAMGLTWFLYARTAAPRVERTARIIAAARDLPAGTQLRRGDLKLISMPERDMPRAAITDPSAAYNRALLFPMNSNEPVTTTKLSSLTGAEGVAATIEPGMRAVSVGFTDSTGASGLIQPRSRVDVLYTRGGNVGDALTTTILEDVVVLSIGRNTEVQPFGAVAGKQQPVRTANQTATLMVTPEEARKLELAKSQGKISLALRNPLDRSRAADAAAATADSLDPQLLASRRFLKDRKAWARLTAGDAKPKPEPPKEPPKPKLVVDVFRGDKHVQETFQ